MRLAFWNCGVAPSKGDRRDANEAASLVERVFASGVAVVGLCEVDAEAMRALQPADHGIGQVVLDGEIGKSRWDLGVFFRHDEVEVTAHQPIEVRSGTHVVRAAHSVLVGFAGEIFRLYLLHWRSRLRGEAAHRQRAAYALAKSVEADLDENLPVVILGDFNDEPFDESLNILGASRDPRHVLRAPKQRLYNPCWHLAAPPSQDPWGSYGTLGYAGRTSQRYLLDQVLTSAHFLRANDGPTPIAAVWPMNANRRPTQQHHSPVTLELPWPPQTSTTPSNAPST